jgi:hypothetical protein
MWILLHILQNIILSIPWLKGMISNWSRGLLCLLDILNYFTVIYVFNS